jgi:hypothetical protein
MYGRVDMQQYFNGLEIAENCLVRPYGLIMNRPGSQYIAPVKFPTKTTRLIDFVFNESDAFVIELGEGYFRFFTLGAAVTETPTTITAATQADPCALTITAHGYAVDDEIIVSGVVGMTELNNNRYRVNTVPDPNTITLKDLDGNTIDSTGFTAYVSGGTAERIYEVTNPFTEADIPDIHYAQINDVLNLVHGDYEPKELIRSGTTNWTLFDVGFIGGPVQDANIDTAITITPSADTGATTLTASSPIFLAGHVGSTWRVKNGYVDITGFTSTTIVTGTVQTGDNLGTGPGATSDWAEAAWSDVAGYPATVTYHERRRWYARTNTQPQTEWASKPFVYDDFTIGPDADDALNLTLNTEKANDIKWLSSGTTLATGTFGGEFVTSSGTNGITLTPDNANASRQTGWGSRNLQPQKIGNFVYYVQRAGRKIRELFYYWDLDTYKSVDMTVLSEHITESGVVDIAYQQNPDSTLWCLRDDGQFAVLVREEDQEVKAWTRIKTGDDKYKTVTTIPSNEGPYDEVWYTAERTINGSTRQYVERFADPVVPDRQAECFYVDSGLSYDAYAQTTGNSLTLSALTGTGVTATAGSAIFESNDVGQRIRAVDEDGEFVGELKITGFTSSTIVTGDVTFDFNSLTYAANRWGVSVTEIDGLDHLEASTVSILGDGAVQTQQVVSGGMITLEIDSFEVNVGLQYTATLKTLSVESGSATGTAQGKKKRFYQLGLRVYKTLGIKVGGTVDKLNDVTLRDPRTLMGLPEALVSDTIPNIRFNGGWVYEGTVVIVQDNPLPMHILDIMPLLQTSDR